MADETRAFGGPSDSRGRTEVKFSGWVWVPVHTTARQFAAASVHIPGDEPDEPTIVEARP